MARDLYRRRDARAVRDALEDLASPCDSYGFASTGVYVFFDPESRDVLYIGLARDLPVRFAQHHGMLGCPTRSCKRTRIQAHFRRHDTLGLAVVLQGPLDQSDTARWREDLARAGVALPAAVYDEEHPGFADLPGEGLEHARVMEGILIEAYRRQHATWPPWNATGGAVEGQRRATLGAYALLETATGRSDSLLLARRTLRQLSADPATLNLEGLLHAARVEAFLATFGRDLTTWHILRAVHRAATATHPGSALTAEEAQRVIDTGYWREPPPPPASPDAPGAVTAASHPGPVDGLLSELVSGGGA